MVTALLPMKLYAALSFLNFQKNKAQNVNFFQNRSTLFTSSSEIFGSYGTEPLVKNATRFWGDNPQNLSH